MTQIKGDIPEIIRLQLRKPTNWGWELSTFKPSRNVSLPTIQLFNYKGELLVEAKDNGETERTWKSSTLPNKASATNAKKESETSRARHLRRSRSDTLNHNSSANNISRNKFESINRKDGNRQPNNKIKSFDGSLHNSATKAAKAATDTGQENKETGSKATEVITESGRVPEWIQHRLKKSKSETSQCKGNFSSDLGIHKRNSFQTLQEFVQNSEARHHRRSKSDELLKRKLRSSEESVKRAELDGYINFITPDIPHHKSQDKLNRNKKVPTTADTVLVDNNTSSIVVNDCRAKKYKTRTSSAGTLIISEESFNDSHSRRRRQKVGNADKAPIEEKNGDIVGNARKLNAGVHATELLKGIQRVSFPTTSISGKYAFNPQPTIAETSTLDKLSSNTGNGVGVAVNDSYMDKNQRWNKLVRNIRVSNESERNTHTKPVRHTSNPTYPISRTNAFNQDLNIAHSNSHSPQTQGNHVTAICPISKRESNEIFREISTIY
ncbi:hypothetical protein NQ315_015235 [Exocentrus adspersus]|uniref:Uncharacterized protein n=1 Tax=Exocentrus adspersus TaxID=1586481 RepID=A0AAV8VBD4_9CUCU|nr:hypothetical protein NQ315_015235 [Exocentrus adspersus]